MSPLWVGVATTAVVMLCCVLLSAIANKERPLIKAAIVQCFEEPVSQVCVCVCVCAHAHVSVAWQLEFKRPISCNTSRQVDQKVARVGRPTTDYKIVVRLWESGT